MTADTPNPFRLTDLENTLALTVKAIADVGGEVETEYAPGSVTFTLAGEPCVACGHFVIAGAMCLYCCQKERRER